MNWNCSSFIYIHKGIPRLFLLLAFFMQACNSNKTTAVKENIIEVITTAMDFQMADEIPSGWNTFHYVNNSPETHFFLLDKLPEGRTIADSKNEVIPVFQKGMDLINEGKPDDAMKEFGKLPAWFSEIIYCGGSGLVSPGKSSLTTLKLDPGYYVMECYVKMANGMFHGTMGMIKAFRVTDSASGNQPPASPVPVVISGTEGISFPQKISKGKNTFSVFFKDQKAHENFVGHDVNLVKLEANHNLETLEKWMNWAEPEGLISPQPEGIIFLGGVNDMAAGNTGYFTVDLIPGNYAFISEVPHTQSKGLLKTFEVAE